MGELGWVMFWERVSSSFSLFGVKSSETFGASGPACIIYVRLIFV